MAGLRIVDKTGVDEKGVDKPGINNQDNVEDHMVHPILLHTCMIYTSTFCSFAPNLCVEASKCKHAINSTFCCSGPME